MPLADLTKRGDKTMRFARDIQQEMEPVDILLKNPGTGNVDTIALGVQMLILPVIATPDAVTNLDTRPDRPRFAGLLETPRDDFRDRNNIVRRADGSELVITRVLNAAGIQELEMESVGGPQ